MFGQILTIARNTFVESLRQPIFFVVVLLAGVLQYLTTWGTGFAMGTETATEVSGDNKLLLDVGLSTVFVCGMLLAAFVATAVISREIENKTVLTVVSKPIGRPTVIVGKYLGVSGAILVALVIMLAFLLLGVRHGVRTNASDLLDGPVILLSISAVGLSIVLAAAANYLYGWPFGQTAMLVMAPLVVLAYLLVLMISKEWAWQPIGKDFKPQITLACVALTLAILVLTAVATAASTRLGQVMTIVVCAGVFMLGLLSNYLVGRHAFINHPVGQVLGVTPDHPTEAAFATLGDTLHIRLQNPPTDLVRPGQNIYWSPNPSGYPITPPPAPRFEGDPSSNDGVYAADQPGRALLRAVDGSTITIENAGGVAARVASPPTPGDWIFLNPTSGSPALRALWALIPNMHYYWLLDAVSQNSPVPVRHLALIAGYAALQIVAFLSLAIVLFQKRDVG